MLRPDFCPGGPSRLALSSLTILRLESMSFFRKRSSLASRHRSTDCTPLWSSADRTGSVKAPKIVAVLFSQLWSSRCCSCRLRHQARAGRGGRAGVKLLRRGQR